VTADPYETFLSSTDMPTWQASLHELLRRLDTATDGPVRLLLLSQAVTVSGYLSWLSRVAGKPAAPADRRGRPSLAAGPSGR